MAKTKFKGIRQLQDHSRPTLRDLKINVILTNRICYGIAAVQIGGRAVKGMPKYCIGAADFHPASEEAFDFYVAPKSNELEDKPAPITSFVFWYQCAVRQCYVLSCFFGQEWFPIWTRALDWLYQQNQDFPCIWVPRFVMDLREEFLGLMLSGNPPA